MRFFRKSASVPPVMPVLNKVRIGPESEATPQSPAPSFNEHRQLIRKVLTDDLTHRESLYRQGRLSFREVEEARAALDSVAALQPPTHH